MSTRLRGNSTITLIVTCLGSFMVILDASIIVTALPTIQNSFHAKLSDLQWAVDAFTLSFAAFMLVGGTLGDRFGRKRFFLIGLVLFLIGSTICGLSPTLGWLLCGRVVQGVGAAALAPGSLSVLAVTFPEARERARAIGIWAGVSGLGLAMGPFLGGWLVGIASWPAIFFVNLPVGIIVLGLSVPKLAESRNPHARNIDVPGQLLVIGGLLCLVMALIEGSSVGWLSPLIVGLLVGAIICISAFLLVESRVDDPMVPLNLFKNRIFSVANIASIVLGCTMMGSLFFLVQFLQDVQGYTAFESGLRMLPTSVGIFAVGPFVGRLTARIGPRLPIILGTLLSAASLFLIATTLQPDTSYAMLWWQITLFGIGIGFMLTPLTAAVLAATPRERSGLGSSILNTTRQLGITLGIAVLGAIVNQQFPGNLAYQFARHGLSGSGSTALVEKLASAGAGANQISQQASLPLPLAVVHQAIGLAFVDALHSTFLISAISLFLTAILVAVLLRDPKPAIIKNIETSDLHGAATTFTSQNIAEGEVTR